MARSCVILFISFTCLVVFSCMSLKDLFASSVKTSICLIVFSYIFKGLINFFFKGLYPLYKIGFKVIFLCFGCVRISRACCGGRAMLWTCHIALGFVDSVFCFVLCFVLFLRPLSYLGWWLFVPECSACSRYCDRDESRCFCCGRSLMVSLRLMVLVL